MHRSCQRHILHVHRTTGCLNLQLTDPEHRTFCDTDHKFGSTSNADGIFRVTDA
jgi:hypothetical protein